MVIKGFMFLRLGTIKGVGWGVYRVSQSVLAGTEPKRKSKKEMKMESRLNPWDASNKEWRL